MLFRSNDWEMKAKYTRHFQFLSIKPLSRLEMGEGLFGSPLFLVFILLGGSLESYPLRPGRSFCLSRFIVKCAKIHFFKLSVGESGLNQIAISPKFDRLEMSIFYTPIRHQIHF